MRDDGGAAVVSQGNGKVEWENVRFRRGRNSRDSPRVDGWKMKVDHNSCVVVKVSELWAFEYLFWISVCGRKIFGSRIFRAGGANRSIP